MPIKWRLGSTRKALLVAVALVLAMVALIVARSTGGDGDLVVSDTGASSAVGGATDRPAVAVPWPGADQRSTAATSGGVPASAEDTVTSAGGDLEGPGHAESAGHHSVVVEDGPGGGLVVTNSGRAVADSGGNSGAAPADGETTGIESGDVDAEGNRSTTHVGP